MGAALPEPDIVAKNSSAALQEMSCFVFCIEETNDDEQILAAALDAVPARPVLSTPGVQGRKPCLALGAPSSPAVQNLQHLTTSACWRPCLESSYCARWRKYHLLLNS